MAAGHAAVRDGLRVRYLSAAELIESLYRGLADNSVGKHSPELEAFEALDEETVDEFAHEATVWVEGLDRIAKASGRGISFCVDLSATPYYLARAGADTNRIFPWVASDLG